MMPLMQREMITLSKSEKERQIPCDITYMWNLNSDTNEPTYERFMDVENRLEIAKGKGGGGGTEQQFGISRYKLLYRQWINTQAYWVAPASLAAQLAVKRPPAIQETQAQSLGGEDPLEEEMATHPSILLWEIPWTEEPGGLQSMGSQRVRWDRATEHTHCIPEGTIFNTL